MKKILWVTPDFPFPPNHGGRFDVHRRLIEAGQQGFDIHLVATIKADPSFTDIENAKKLCSRVDLVHRVQGFSAAVRGCPYQVATRNKLALIFLNQRYDLLIMETEYVSDILRNPSLIAEKVALRIQNDESVYFKNLAKSVGFGLRSFYYWYEMFAFKRFSKKLKNSVNVNWYISKDETARDEIKYPNVVHVPTPFLPLRSLQDSESTSVEKKSHHVLFVGSLFMVNNLEGLNWYINNIHFSLFDISGYSLIIAGNCNGVSEEILQKLESVDRVVVYRTPLTLDDIYSKASVFINPMQHGAGVKMKTLNAIEYGLPVVSTTIGSEGLDLRENLDILKADDSESFSQKIRYLLENPDKAVQLACVAQIQSKKTSSFLPHLNSILNPTSASDVV